MFPLRISDIKSYPIWVGHRNQLVVKVETDEGVFGLGESGLSGRELAVVGAINHYREFLIGKDPRQLGALWQEMYRSQYFEGGRVLTAAIAAIDIALHDLKGKALGVPVYELLGGKQRDLIPCFATVGISSAESRAVDPDQSHISKLIADVQLLIDNDWPCIRVNMAGSGAAYGDDVFERAATVDATDG